MGMSTAASGFRSTAMGSHTTASSFASTVIGRRNVGGKSPDSWNGGDSLFEISNYGGTKAAISKAMTVLNNGFTAVGSHLVYPLSVLEVVPPTTSNLGQAFSIRNKDANEAWQMHVDGGGTLHLYRNGENRGYFHNVNGNHVSVSDCRRKAQIEALPQGTLDQLLQLRPVSYYMKDQQSGDRNLGLIAQEVDGIFPTIAKYDAEADLYSLSYTELIPVLIKAVQEQHALIVAQKEKLAVNDKILVDLEARLTVLEKMITGGNSKKLI